MERRLAVLLVLFVSLTMVSCFTVAVPLFGLSTVLGSSVLGSSVLGSSVLGSSVMGTTIVEAYSLANSKLQFYLSLTVIGLLIYLEMSDPAYMKIRVFYRELRRGWIPVSVILVVLFFIIVAVKVWAIIG